MMAACVSQLMRGFGLLDYRGGAAGTGDGGGMSHAGGKTALFDHFLRFDVWREGTGATEHRCRG